MKELTYVGVSIDMENNTLLLMKMSGVLLERWLCRSDKKPIRRFSEACELDWSTTNDRRWRVWENSLVIYDCIDNSSPHYCYSRRSEMGREARKFSTRISLLNVCDMAHDSKLVEVISCFSSLFIFSRWWRQFFILLILSSHPPPPLIISSQLLLHCAISCIVKESVYEKI